MHLQVWQPQHDKKLLFGVLKHGWDQWLLILKDPLLDLEPFVRQELYLTPTQPQQLASVSSVNPAAPPQLLAQAAPANLTTSGLDAPMTSAAAGSTAAVPAAAVAVGADVGPNDKSADAAEPGSTSCKKDDASKAEGSPDGESGQPVAQPDSMHAGTVKGQISSQGVKHALSTSAQPAVADAPAADAPIADAENKLKELLGGVKVDSKPASANPPSALSILETEGPLAVVKLEAAAAAVSAAEMAGPTEGLKLEPATAAESKSQKPTDAVTAKPNQSGNATVQPQTVVTQPPLPAQSDVVDLTAAETPSTNPAAAGSGPAETATNAAVPASDASAAATSTAAECRLAAPPPVAAAASTTQAPVVLGCPKCRWAPKGCSVCRGKWQAAGNALTPTLSTSGNSSVDAGAAARAERTIITRLANWLLNRTNVLASVLKGTHKVGPAIAGPPQSKMPATVPAPRLIPSKQAGPVITTSSGPRPSGATIVPGAAVVTGANMQTVLGTPAYPGQWQQNAVQMSHFRQQQRQLQQQQLATAQEQQRQNLLLQQQQRQHHTSLLRQQHQSAQLQQQQAAKVQAVQAQAVQQQQVRMRQQQQQQGLRQQQLNQQNQLQLQRQQQLLLQQQRQRTSQQQVQRAVTSQGLQPSTSLQPQAADAYVSAAQHAQQQHKPTASQAQISHPLSKWPAGIALCPGSVRVLFPDIMFLTSTPVLRFAHASPSSHHWWRPVNL